MSTLEEVRHWPLDAGNDSLRYFYARPSQFERLQRLRCALVVGRRGAGKSALARRLHNDPPGSAPSGRRKSAAFFVPLPDELAKWAEISAKSLPDLTQAARAARAQLRWKASILGAVRAELVGRERAKLPPLVRQTLEKTDELGSKFRVLLGDITIEPRADDLSALVHHLHVAVRDKLRSRWDAWCLVDEIDSAFAARMTDADRAEVSALIRASIEIGQQPDLEGLRIVIFLRDDIFNHLAAHAKLKWQDHELRLDWSDAELKRMMAFRVMRAEDPDASDLQHPEIELEKFFGPGDVDDEPGKVPKFDYLARRTLRRPRDYVAFFSKAANHALESGERQTISSSSLKDSAPEWRAHLWRDIRDELDFLEDADRMISALRGAAQGARLSRREALTRLQAGSGQSAADIEAQLASALDRMVAIGAMREESDGVFTLATGLA